MIVEKQGMFFTITATSINNAYNAYKPTFNPVYAKILNNQIIMLKKPKPEATYINRSMILDHSHLSPPVSK